MEIFVQERKKQDTKYLDEWVFHTQVNYSCEILSNQSYIYDFFLGTYIFYE